MLTTEVAPLTKVGIADGQRQTGRLSAKHTALIDQLHIGRMTAAGQVAGNIGQANTDKHDAAAFQGARSADDHSFGWWKRLGDLSFIHGLAVAARSEGKSCSVKRRRKTGPLSGCRSMSS